MPDDNQDITELFEEISSKTPDLVEFRLDRIHDMKKIETIAQSKASPTIATDKNDSETAVAKKLLTAATAGFDYVDIDVSHPRATDLVREIKSRSTKIIISSHDLHKTPPPAELKTVLDSEMRLGADICKIVTTANHPRDNLVVLNFLESKPAASKVVSFAMGSLGTPSRILCPLFGAEFTFAALDEDTKTAQGQLSIDRLRSAWQLFGIQ